MLLSNEQAIQSAIVEIPMGSREYPKAWQTLPDAPKTLYAIGDTSLLAAKKLAVVGSRTTPANALKLGGEIAKTLSEQLVLVTGTADGGDTAAIEGALRGSGRIICLLAGGFSALPQYNLLLLQQVIGRGLLLSPHPYETQVRSFSYEYRNKLLATLGEGVFVLGAGEKSGALITAKYAEKFGVPVFAFPYPPNSVSGCGCNALIKRGGRLVESAEDIAKGYGLTLKKKEELLLSEEERRVYTLLRERLECHVTELAALTGVPSFKLRGVLSALEVKGVIVAVGGNRYAIV